MNRIALTLLAGVSLIGFASATQAADLIIDTPTVVPGVVETTGGNWDGMFIGGFAGYSVGDVGPGTGIEEDEFDINGWLLGATVGANWTVSNGLVLGVVADLAWNGVGDDFDDGDDAGDFEDFGIDWTGSLRGRVGFDGGAFMPYLTGGLAVAGAAYDFDGDIDDTDTYFGWTVGAGVEFAVSENVSLDLLYRYSDYGTQDFGDTDEYDLQTHAITAGINFKF